MPLQTLSSLDRNDNAQTHGQHSEHYAKHVKCICALLVYWDLCTLAWWSSGHHGDRVRVLLCVGICVSKFSVYIVCSECIWRMFMAVCLVMLFFYLSRCNEAGRPRSFVVQKYMYGAGMARASMGCWATSICYVARPEFGGHFDDSCNSIGQFLNYKINIFS